MTKPLLVGEDNPYGADPQWALWCEPAGSAGARLAYKVLGCRGPVEYARLYDRANLCARRWAIKEARESARRLASVQRPAFVLLGARVCAAFEVAFEPFCWGKFSLWSSGPQQKYVVLPHPSGRCRLWNADHRHGSATAFESARATLRAADVALPDGPPDVGDLPSASYSTRRPARCDNCGGLVEGEHCPACGAP